ncbi:branched-chain amino acid aminotransferase [Streptomyces sp. NPDC006655]|uniref:branched-chain amino acid aminotransferase n=1 Tax=Streptomyces sp. NPDC006655 TaxID=3156898 RepID=UPI003451DA4B
MTVSSAAPAPTHAAGATSPGESGIGKAEIGDFTPHMVTLRWTEDDGWTAPRLGPHENLSVSPATAALNYGQSIIEGLKAHRQPDGSFAVFRPRDHARRFRSSARRLAMPELPDDLFVDALDRLVEANTDVVPDRPGYSLYLRPYMFASEANVVPRPAREYTVVVISFLIGSYFGDSPDGVCAWVCRDYARAFPGGTGSAKTPGNYAPTMPAQLAAGRAGCQQVVWLDAVERRWVEEMGSANLFFVRGSGDDLTVVTPPLNGNFLPGITRDSVIAVATELGHRVSEEPVALDEWREGCASGLITETFGCGTAAVVTAVGRVRDGDREWTVGDGTTGPVTSAVKERLLAHHHGLIPDVHGWRHSTTTGARR